MCGIAGIVSSEARGYGDRLARMVRSLCHRGPDAEGTHFFDGCALGHTRLSIVDLETGDQPMLSLDDRRGLVLNGEIYGYREIRDGLSGFPFRTRSDTEVLLVLYGELGDDLLPELPGMFAFALWDEDRGRLLAARDRFGEKPLYYAFSRDGELLFASELKAILASGLVDPVLSRDAVAHYLQRRFVHPRRTIYSNVHALPPAHRLVFEGGRLSVEPYWRLPEPGPALDMGEAVERFRDLLTRAVERQLVADVPVGAFLSGGLDSSTIVAVASRLRPGLRTISFGFGGGMDERPFAREVASMYGTKHLEVEEPAIDVGELLVRMTHEVYDEPFADSSAIPTFALSGLAREHLKVVLTGDGGDELLAGYSFWYPRLLDMERERGRSLFRMLLLRAATKWSRMRGRGEGPARRLRGIGLRRRYGTIGRAHREASAYFTDADLALLGLPAPEEDPIPGGDPDTVDDALRMDLTAYLPGEILVKTDRASMAHGLELRAPFLDVEVASFLAALPSSLKIDEREDKILLRRAFEADWPESIRGRGKQGFGAPVDEWLRREDLAPLIARTLDDPGSALHDVLPRAGVEAFRHEGLHRTWALLVLGLWLETHPADLREFEGRAP